MVAGLLGRARAGLAPLASPDALSWTVIGVFCPVAFLVQVSGNAAAAGGPLGLWALASLVGMVVLAGVLLATRVATATRGGPSLGVVLVGYFAATIVQALVFGYSAIALGATSEPQVVFRLMAPLWNMPLLMAVGLGVSSHASHRRVITELEQKRARLLELGPSLDSELDRLQGELAGAVRASLDPALASLDAALTTAARGGGADQMLDALDAIVEHQVRPLSRELVADAVRPAGEELAAAAQAPARVPLPLRFPFAGGVRPTLAAGILLLAALPTAVRDLDASQAVTFVLALPLLCWLGLCLLRRSAGQRQLRTSVGVVVIVLAHMLVVAVALALLDVSVLAAPQSISAAAVVLFGAIGACIVSALLVRERRAESEAALAEANERLERAVALMLRRQRLVRRRLAFVLHGSLQGALHAAALRVGEGAALDAEEAGRIRDDVAAALTQLDAPREANGECLARAALDELTEVWRGRRRVINQWAPGVDEVLKRDSDADEAVAEVVREAVNNAFRHGSATTVRVEVSFPADMPRAQPACVVICVRDDGRGCDGEVRPGMGTALMDDLCRTWHRLDGADGTTFRGEVMLTA
jgi:signal transduction histidine kinase